MEMSRWVDAASFITQALKEDAYRIESRRNPVI